MKKEKMYLIILALIPIIFFSIVLLSGNLFGSYVDWINQHTAFPHYFREMFYETGDIIPNFALNLGAGQNMFNVAYYGLCSPVILLSYLFPFIPMHIYLMIISVVLSCVSVILLYKWLLLEQVESSISFIVSLIFILSGPILFHAHRHLMFVNYIPFLIMGLIGIKRYMDSRKWGLISTSTVLLILTSFYYSIPSLLCMGIYMIYCYIRKNKKINIKLFFKDNLKNMLPFFLGILLCSFYLLPVFYTIITGRGEITSDISFISTLIPRFSIGNIFYGTYGIGLFCIGLMSIIYSIRRKAAREDRFIGITLVILLFIPIFMYLLNGGLYVRAKVLIPLSPIICLLICKLVDDLFKKRISLKFILSFVIISLLGLVSKEVPMVFYIDLIILTVSILLYNKYERKQIFLVPLFIVILFIFGYKNLNEEYVPISDYNEKMGIAGIKEISGILENDKDIYRFNQSINNIYNINYVYDLNYYRMSIYSSTFNDYYYDFTHNIFHNPNPYMTKLFIADSPNILFDSFMGVRYVSSHNEMGYGYEKLGDNLYKNSNAYPLIYSTNNLISKGDFENLSYPLNVLYLMHNVVIDKDVQSDYEANYSKIDLDYEFVDPDFEVKDNGLFIKTSEEKEARVKINNDLTGKVLLLQLNGLEAQSCNEGDLKITINGISNVLSCNEWLYNNENTTFYYVLSSSDLTQLSVIFSKGTFSIASIEAYTVDYEDLFMDITDKFIFDIDKTKGNYINGNISISNDGYLVTTIPYDNGFDIYVNDKKIDYELINEAFIGFPIDKGEYQITIKYTSPLFSEGVMISSTLFIFLIIFCNVPVKKRLES